MSSLDGTLNALGTQPIFSSAQEGDAFSKGKQVNVKDESPTIKSKTLESFSQQENGKVSNNTT
ncbi:8837_t:CDS:1, partial [Scutellospora calospora]